MLPVAVGAVATLADLASSSRIGQHYFDATGTPTFDLGQTGFLSAAKKADIPAPTDADAGVLGTGAVDWLMLSDKGGSVGLSRVYRVLTAGGKAPATCAGQDSNINVQYTAQYWFYG